MPNGVDNAIIYIWFYNVWCFNDDKLIFLNIFSFIIKICLQVHNIHLQVQ